METPLSKAIRHIEHIEEYCVPEAQLELAINPLHDPADVVFFVSIMGFSPYEAFGPQLKSHSSALAESEEASETVLSWLRSGDDPVVVQKKLRRMQRWEWGAIAVDVPSLSEELQSRYALGASETDFYWERIPTGIVIHLRILPRGSFGDR
jgi:hypothetical protein